MMNKTALEEKLISFGLTLRQADIYLSLLEKGIQSPLELSRLTNINRTTLYRELEELKEKGLIEEIVEEHRIRFSASDPKNLELLLTKKETELQKLKIDLPSVLSQLPPTTLTSPTTRIVSFRGKSGLQQLLWNVLKAEKEHIGYGYTDWNESVGREFAEKLRQECVDRNISSREIQNSTAINYQPYTDNKIYQTKFYSCRYISPKTLDIKHDTYIYNDVFAFCSFYQGELFGVEIHNAEIAKTQKQIFEILWKMAK